MNEPEIKRNKEIKKVLILILILNWAVAAAKIFFGLLTRSASIAADGFHSFSDGTSNVIGLIGMKFASQPTDADHPYGHKKYETFFSLTIGALLFFVAFNLCREGIARLSKPVLPEIDMRSFAVMILTLLTNIWVMRYEYKKGRALHSDILTSDSKHTRADIFVSSTVIAALGIIKINPELRFLDPLLTLFIALVIVYAAFGIVRDSSKVLCDSAAITDTKKIEDVVLGVKGVKTCHKIRTRGREDDIHIDLHVQVNPHMHIDEAHKICYTIEETIIRAIPGVTDVLVHVEPRKNEPREKKP
ncbi:MAG: cation diffusion facilitator family transporter [Candidatus Omnitrophota bacterium]|jgi:cation diffusion facilitator family transporter